MLGKGAASQGQRAPLQPVRSVLQCMMAMSPAAFCAAQVHPTHARSFGAAVTDSFGRIGGFAAPYAVGACMGRPMHAPTHADQSRPVCGGGWGGGLQSVACADTQLPRLLRFAPRRSALPGRRFHLESGDGAGCPVRRRHPRLLAAAGGDDGTAAVAAGHAYQVACAPRLQRSAAHPRGQRRAERRGWRERR